MWPFLNWIPKESELANKLYNSNFSVKMAQVQLYLVLSIAIVMVCLANNSDACFITNCPPGGKRSVMTSLTSNQFRKECTRCGPAYSGRCYGPNICCSPLIGCNIGGAAAARCALEAYSCTSDGCFRDKNCVSFTEVIGQDSTL